MVHKCGWDRGCVVVVVVHVFIRGSSGRLMVVDVW